MIFVHRFLPNCISPRILVQWPHLGESRQFVSQDATSSAGWEPIGFCCFDPLARAGLTHRQRPLLSHMDSIRGTLFPPRL